MKILQVIEPGCDGAFRHVEALIHGIISCGARVSLAYSSIRSSDRLEPLVRRVRTAGGDTLDLRVGNAPQGSDFQAMFQLWSLVRRGKFDVVHLHSSKAGALGRALWFLGCRTPLVYTPHAYFGMGGTGGVKRRVFNEIEWALGHIGTTINVSSDEAEWARVHIALNPARQKVIPNAVDTSHFAPGDEKSRENWRLCLRLPPDSVLLGTVGRLSFQKDPHTLYRALALACADQKHLYLCHLANGTPEDADAIDKLARSLGIAQRVLRRPYMTDPLDFYRGIDAFILTSRYEGMSYAVLEALSCDLPLLLSDVPGNRDFLKLGLSHVWSAPAEDSPSFARAINEWLVDRSAKRNSNHRFMARDRFDLTVSGEAIMSLYCELIDSRYRN